MAMMKLEKLRAEIDALGPASNRRRYPDVLRARVRAYVMARRSEGAAWLRISKELGIAYDTVRSFSKSFEPRFGRVEVGESSEEVPNKDATGGAIENLSIESAAALIRALLR